MPSLLNVIHCQNMPNVNTRFGGGAGSPDGGHFSVFTSSVSSSSDVNGKPSSFHQASTTVNDNGKVSTYTVRNPWVLRYLWIIYSRVLIFNKIVGGANVSFDFFEVMMHIWAHFIVRWRLSINLSILIGFRWLLLLHLIELRILFV